MMEQAQNLFAVFFAAFLINNILLMRFLGLCSFFGLSNQQETSLGMGMAVTFVMAISSAAAWLLYYFVLVPFHLEFLRTAGFILVIAGLVQLEEMYIKKFLPALYKAMGIYLPLITTNCAILGVAFLSIDYKYGFIETILYALGVSLGYTLVIVLFSVMRERLAEAPIPKIFTGYPIAFITAALMALAFLGFSNLFGI
jgi:electron transport complex protein RnfA